MVLSCNQDSDTSSDLKLSQNLLDVRGETIMEPQDPSFDPANVCIDQIDCYGTLFEFANFDISIFRYDVSDCVDPDPLGGKCTISGYVDYAVCVNLDGSVEVTIKDLENFVIGAEDCFGLDVDSDCIEDIVIEKVLPYIVQDATKFPQADPDYVITTKFYKQLCAKYCYSATPYPQYTLNYCEGSYSCCVQTSLWAQQPTDPPYGRISTGYQQSGGCQGALQGCWTKKGGDPLESENSISCTARPCNAY